MAISVLQERETSVTGPVSSLGLAFSSNLTAASSIHAAGTWGSSGTSTMADTANGTFGAAVTHDFDSGNGETLDTYIKDNSASGADTVTLSISSANFVGICIREIGNTSGVDAGSVISAIQVNPGTTTDIIKAGAKTPGTQPGLISAFDCDTSGSSTTVVAGTGYVTGILQGWTNTGALTTESLRYTSLSSQNASFTDGTNGGVNTYISASALFKETVVSTVSGTLMGQICT